MVNIRLELFVLLVVHTLLLDHLWRILEWGKERETELFGLCAGVMGISVQNCSIGDSFTTFLSTPENVHMSLSDEE